MGAYKLDVEGPHPAVLGERERAEGAVQRLASARDLALHHQELAVVQPYPRHLQGGGGGGGRREEGRREGGEGGGREGGREMRSFLKVDNLEKKCFLCTILHDVPCAGRPELSQRHCSPPHRLGL